MPCSALIEPPSADDLVVEPGQQQRRSRSTSAGEVTKLKWRLPSPTWPNGISATSGAASATQAAMRSINTGRSEMATVTSLRTMWPMCRVASDAPRGCATASPAAPRCRRCVPSATSPRSSAPRARSRPARAVPRQSSRRSRSAGATDAGRPRAAAPRADGSPRPRRRSWSSSKLEISSPSSAWNSRSNSSAVAGSGCRAKASPFARSCDQASAPPRSRSPACPRRR